MGVESETLDECLMIFLHVSFDLVKRIELGFDRIQSLLCAQMIQHACLLMQKCQKLSASHVNRADITNHLWLSIKPIIHPVTNPFSCFHNETWLYWHFIPGKWGMVSFPIAIASHVYAYQSFNWTFLDYQILNCFSM